MNAMLSIFFVVTFSFKDQFLEDVIVTCHNATIDPLVSLKGCVKPAKAEERQKYCAYLIFNDPLAP